MSPADADELRRLRHALYDAMTGHTLDQLGGKSDEEVVADLDAGRDPFPHRDADPDEVDRARTRLLEHICHTLEVMGGLPPETTARSYEAPEPPAVANVAAARG